VRRARQGTGWSWRSKGSNPFLPLDPLEFEQALLALTDEQWVKMMGAQADSTASAWDAAYDAEEALNG